MDTRLGKSSLFKLTICISCLHDTVCICGQIFMKFAQFIYIINGLNPINFEINLAISKEKVANFRFFFFLNYFFYTTVTNSLGNCDLKCIQFFPVLDLQELMVNAMKTAFNIFWFEVLIS